MSSGNCNYENCRFFHSRRLEINNELNQNSNTNQVYKQDIHIYAQVVRKAFTPKLSSSGHSHFLGNILQQQQSSIKQENQTQDHFLEFMKSQKGILRRLEKLEIQTTLNQC